MAEKRKGGGGIFWGFIGFLVGVGTTLAVLTFMTQSPTNLAVGRTAADDAAVNAMRATQQTDAPPTAMPPAPAPGAAVPTGAAPPPSDQPRPPPTLAPGADPATDDQVADDAAAAGMTSRSKRDGAETPY